MAKGILERRRFFFRKAATWFLAFSWTLGFFCGILLFCNTDGSVLSLMRRSIYTPVSIVSLLFTCIFPFLLSALAVFLSFPWLLPVIGFVKAFLLSFVLAGLAFAWGNSAWLLQLYVLSCDLAFLPFLYMFCFRHVSGETPCFFTECMVMLLTGCLVVCIAYFEVIPFFADVLIL